MLAKFELDPGYRCTELRRRDCSQEDGSTCGTSARTGTSPRASSRCRTCAGCSSRTGSRTCPGSRACTSPSANQSHACG